MPDAPYLQPFVVDTPPTLPTRHDDVDLYLPATEHDVPLVVLDHGGPMRTPPLEPPTRWPVYIGYASLLASQGAAVAMFNHKLLTGDPAAAEQLKSAIHTARHADGVDPARITLWFFSGAGVLSPPYLNAPPTWLRRIAFSYAVLDDEDPEWDPRAALHPGLSVPLLVTRVGQENPGLVEGQQQFIDKAARLGVPLSIIDVPHGKHAFDSAEPTTESKQAVIKAVQWILRPSATG